MILSSLVEVPTGSRSADIRIDIDDDGLYEGEEIVVLALTGDGLYNVGTRDRYLLTIVDDEPAPDDARLVSFQNFDAHGEPRRGCERNEGQGGCRPAFFTYGGHLDNPLDVVIKYAGGTATLDEDFEFTGDPAGVGETFTVRVPAGAAGDFPADATVAWIEGLWPIADGKSDDRETVVFRLVNGPGYVVGDDTPEFTVTIRD